MWVSVMANWLITGGCGFIGANLCLEICDKFPMDEVVIIDRIVRYVDNIPRIKIYNMEGFDKDMLKYICHKHNIDFFVHLAAQTSVPKSIEHPVYDCSQNTMNIIRCLEATRDSNVKKFLFASSTAVTMPHICPYAISKAACEDYCKLFHRLYGLDTIIVRPSNVYGPYSEHKESVVAKFIKDVIYGEPVTIYGDGKQERDFIYVSDLIDGIKLAINSEVGGRTFNLSTSSSISVLELTKRLNILSQKYLNRRMQIKYGEQRKGDVSRSVLGNVVATITLGFYPRINLEEGLEKTFKWFLEYYGKS